MAQGTKNGRKQKLGYKSLNVSLTLDTGQTSATATGFAGLCSSLPVIFHVIHQAWFISESDVGYD